MKLLNFFLIMAMAAMAAKPPTLTTLYSFTPGNKGASDPYGGLVRAHSGVLYGTTFEGGNFGAGTVYSLTPPGSGATNWLYQVLYSFGTSQVDGAGPSGTLVLGSDGSLFGTTQYGGANYYFGTIYQLVPPPGGTGSWTETVLFSFLPTLTRPISGLAADSSGNLYGTTTSGTGINSIVFRLSPLAAPGGGWTFTTLFTFPETIASAPGFAVPLIDAAGNLYSTTWNGGVDWGPPYGTLGTVYELSPPQPPSWPWNESVIYSFPNPRAGAKPRAGLIMDAAGSLYGVTSENGYSVTHGSVFKLTPPSSPGQPWTEQVLWSFLGPADGSAYAPLAFDAAGNLYGTTVNYGDVTDCPMGCGTVFKLLAPANNPSGAWAIGWNFEFTGTNGATPIGSLVVQDDAVYGVTSAGGQCSYFAGTIFQLQQ